MENKVKEEPWIVLLEDHWIQFSDLNDAIEFLEDQEQAGDAVAGTHNGAKEP